MRRLGGDRPQTNKQTLKHLVDNSCKIKHKPVRLYFLKVVGGQWVLFQRQLKNGCILPQIDSCLLDVVVCCVAGSERLPLHSVFKTGRKLLLALNQLQNIICHCLNNYMYRHLQQLRPQGQH